MHLLVFPKKHPYWWFCLCMAIIGFPQWFQSVWSLFRTDAPIPIIRDWLKTMHMPLPEFSGYWVTVPLGLMMFGLLLYELRLQRVVATSIHRVNEPIQPTTYIPRPDWPIRELFFYLRPDLVDDHKNNLWEKVSLEIRDNLSIGRLQIWGRRRVDLQRTRSNFSLIPPEYWKPEVDFTYWFLEKGHEHAYHVNPPTKLGLPGYSDLHVNKAQALEIWGTEFIRMSDAATKIYSIARPLRQHWAISAEDNAKGFLSMLFRDKVILSTIAERIAERIPIFGEPSPSIVRELIDGSSRGTFSGKGDVYKTEDGTLFKNVSVRSADLESIISYVQTSLTANDQI